MMTSNQIIKKMQEYIEKDCKFQPLSTTKIIVDKDYLDELLRELQIQVSTETRHTNGSQNLTTMSRLSDAAGIIQSVCDDICDNYCELRKTRDDEQVCDRIRKGESCPLDRLL